jgi:hypothetical protein
VLARRPSLARVVLLGLLVTVALLGGLLAWASTHALDAARTLEQAETRLRAAQQTDAEVAQIRSALTEARQLLTRAERDTEALPVRLAAGVPVLGRSFAAERAVVDTSSAAVDGLGLVIDEADGLRAADGRVDVGRVGALATRLLDVSGRAQRALRDLRRTPTALTPSRVSRGVERAERSLSPVVTGLARGALGAQVAAGVLGGSGPRQVLVALENNAELRGTGGYVSTFSTGVFDDGRLGLAPFRDVADVRDEPEAARPVPAPRDFVEDYGSFLAHTTHWRNWTMSADVPDSAAVGAAAAGKLLGTTPDLVVLMDVPALAAVVKLHGQDVVLQDGTRLSGDELVQALLVEEYARGGDQQFARRAALRDAATRTVRTLLQDPPSLETVRTLGRLADGRHLAVWSARPDEQAGLVELGYAGDVDPGRHDLALASLNNLNGAKLDYYVDRTFELDVTVGAENSRVTQRLTLANRAPEGLVSYVEGTERPGEVDDRVELWLAPDVVLERFTLDGTPAKAFVRRRPDVTLLATNVQIARGETAVIEVTYALPTPGGEYRATLIPQALAQDAGLVLTMRAAPGGRLALTEGVRLEPDGTVSSREDWTRRRVVAATLG